MKRYLVAYEGSALSKAALQYAMQFNRCVPGTIDICYIADIRALSNPIFDLTVMAFQGIGMLGDLIPREQAMLEMKSKLIAKGEELLKEVESMPGLIPESGLPVNHTTRVEVANPPTYLADISENYDVLFLGLWGEMSQFKGGLWGGTSETVIRRGKSPVLLSTGEYTPFKKLVVGFDNGPRARQALAWAGMIGDSMDLPITIVSASSDEKVRETNIAEAKKIAGSYGSEFNYLASPDRPAQAIIATCGDDPETLICMGAFGDKPMRELFLGSVAEEVLRKAKSPVLLLK